MSLSAARRTVLIVRMGWNITAAAGIVMIITGIVFAYREHVWLQSAEQADGVVIEMVASRGSKSTTYAPRVQFTARDGRTHEFVRGYSSSPPDFRIGDRVLVAYQLHDFKGRIVTFGQRFGFSVIMISVGLAAALMGLSFKFGSTFVPAIYERQAMSQVATVEVI